MVENQTVHNLNTWGRGLWCFYRLTIIDLKDP